MLRVERSRGGWISEPQSIVLGNLSEAAKQQAEPEIGIYTIAGKRLIFALAPTLIFSLMSQHRSLKGASTIVVKRNVLKRFERVELLRKRGQFKPGDKVIGLRKTMPEA